MSAAPLIRRGPAQPKTPCPPAKPRAARTAVAAVGIVVIAWAAYANSFSGAFVFDDEPEILRNPHMHSLSRPWQAMFGGNGLPPRPLPYLTFAIDYALWGAQPWGYHLTNLVIHAVAAILLFGIVRRALRMPAAGERSAATATTLAFFAAALWVAHPLQTQAVTYIYQRMESLMGMFCLASFYCFARGRDSARAPWWFAGSAVAAAAAMVCKESAVVIVPLILLYDRACASASIRQTLLRRPGYYLALAAAYIPLGLYLATQHQQYAEFRKPLDRWAYAATQPTVVLHYLRLVVYPTGQCLDYWWQNTTQAGETARSLLLLAVPTLALAWFLRRRPRALWLLAAFYLPLLPTSSILPLSDIANEHRMYLALAPLAVGAVLLVEAWLRHIRAAGNNDAPQRRLALVMGALVLLAFVVATHLRNQIYASRTTMWQDVLAKVPHNPRAQTALASEYAQQHPDDADALFRLGELCEQLGLTSDAAKAYGDALQARPDFTAAHVNLGMIYFTHGRNEQAVAEFQAALHTDPSNAEVRANLGAALARSGHIDEALVELTRAVADDARYLGAWVNLGLTYAEAQRWDEALAALDQAARLDPRNALVGRHRRRIATARDQRIAAP